MKNNFVHFCKSHINPGTPKKNQISKKFKIKKKIQIQNQIIKITKNYKKPKKLKF